VTLAILLNKPEILAEVVRGGGRLDTNTNPLADPLRLAVVYSRVACVRTLLHFGVSIWKRLYCFEQRAPYGQLNPAPSLGPYAWTDRSDLQRGPPPSPWNLRADSISAVKMAPRILGWSWLSNSADSRCCFRAKKMNLIEFIRVYRPYSKLTNRYVDAQARRDRLVAAILSYRKWGGNGGPEVPWFLWRKIFSLAL
jgi:hypothetical protein